MAFLRSSLASAAALRSSALMRDFSTGLDASASLHSGQRLAKPGLSGFSSNSSPQTAQTRMGKLIATTILQFGVSIRESQTSEIWRGYDEVVVLAHREVRQVTVRQIVPCYGRGIQAGRHHCQLRHSWSWGSARYSWSRCTGGHHGGR